MPSKNAANQLVHEQSPYLLQHAHNPVLWHAWTDEAFAKAQKEDKPVFVSIGYATCHWCHVMAHESFEDETVAAFLNEHFISIKVDREERPDVDAICMDVCQSLTGHGGWPLSIMMDADRRPFFAGTYYPRHSRGNHLGFLDLLQRLCSVWQTDRKRVLDTAREITNSLSEQAARDFRGDVPADIMDIIADHHRRMFDDVHGGFSVKPKFPSPHHLLLLLRIAHATDDKGLIAMVCTTLDAMRAGGVYDHVGFGFHRYSTDREWLVPHFEKMLYDQAMLMMAYTEAWQLTKDELYRTVVLELADYLKREMTSSDGSFYTAQDADSEGVEGKFYVWSYEELSELSPELLSILNIRVDGNFHDEATGNAVDLNIPHVNMSRLRELVVNKEWNHQRLVLYTKRAARVWPLTDDKVLTDWNGLMIGALARAGRALNNEMLTSMAERAYGAIPHPIQFHRTRNGNSSIAPMLDDHAMIGWAGLELYQSTSDSQYLRDALANADVILDNYADETGALFSVTRDVVDIPIRQKQGYDGAYPCGNSMSALLFVGLGAITNEQRLRDAARACVTTYGSSLARSAPGYCMLLCAWDTISNGSSEIVFNGVFEAPFIAEARRRIFASYQPRAYFVHRPRNDEDATLLQNSSYPFDLSSVDSVLICNDYVCELPITDIDLISD